MQLRFCLLTIQAEKDIHSYDMDRINVSSFVHFPRLRDAPPSSSQNAADSGSLSSDCLSRVQSCSDFLDFFRHEQEASANNLECSSVLMPEVVVTLSGSQLEFTQSRADQEFAVPNGSKDLLRSLICNEPVTDAKDVQQVSMQKFASPNMLKPPVENSIEENTAKHIKMEEKRENFIEQIIKERGKHRQMPWGTAAENCNARLKTDERFSVKEISRLHRLACKRAGYRANQAEQSRDDRENVEKFIKQIIKERDKDPQMRWRTAAENCNARLIAGERLSKAQISTYSTRARKRVLYEANTSKIDQEELRSRGVSPGAEKRFRDQLSAMSKNKNTSWAELAADLNKRRVEEGKKPFTIGELSAMTGRVKTKLSNQKKAAAYG